MQIAATVMDPQLCKKIKIGTTLRSKYPEMVNNYKSPNP